MNRGGMVHNSFGLETSHCAVWSSACTGPNAADSDGNSARRACENAQPEIGPGSAPATPPPS
eukprot:5873522-Amphidinium_carterae.1